MKIDTSDPYYKTEPKFIEGQVTSENYRKNLSDTLNWYSAKSDTSDWKKWGHEYLTKKHFALDWNKVSNTMDASFHSVGIIWRMTCRGFPEDLLWPDMSKAHVELMTSLGNKPSEVPATKVVKKSFPVFSVEEKNFLDEMYIAQDLFVQAEKKHMASVEQKTIDSIRNFPLVDSKPEFRKRVLEVFSKPLMEYAKYSSECFSPTFIRERGTSYVDFLTSCIAELHIAQLTSTPHKNSSTSAAAASTTSVRKIKAPKPRDPKKLVSKLLLKSKDKKLDKIIGSEVLYVYEPETRMLHFYSSSTKEEGFSVKGKTLQNFDEK